MGGSVSRAGGHIHPGAQPELFLSQLPEVVPPKLVPQLLQDKVGLFFWFNAAQGQQLHFSPKTRQIGSLRNRMGLFPPCDIRP